MATVVRRSWRDGYVEERTPVAGNFAPLRRVCRGLPARVDPEDEAVADRQTRVGPRFDLVRCGARLRQRDRSDQGEEGHGAREPNEPPSR